MARMPRLVVPYFPHHVTQRGNRRQCTFFNDADYLAYLKFLAEGKATAAVEIWAYCLMPNHVHFVVVPERENGLSNLFCESHRRYSRRINVRHGWCGHLWQERFHSVVMDEQHLMAAVRYVELNPVRAGLCKAPVQWRWSSAQAHLTGIDDDIVTTAPMRARVDDWRKYMAAPGDESVLARLREHSRTGRPVGDESFMEVLVRMTGRDWRKRKPGPGKKDK
jgi:putative transposase